MFDDIFLVLYLVGLLVGSLVRFWYLRKYRQDRFAIFKREGKLVLGGVIQRYHNSYL